MSNRVSRTGSGGPSFCWVCMRQLQRAPGKGKGLFYFQLVEDREGHQHRVHDQCVKEAASDGNKLVKP